MYAKIMRLGLRGTTWDYEGRGTTWRGDGPVVPLTSFSFTSRTLASKHMSPRDIIWLHHPLLPGVAHARFAERDLFGAQSVPTAALKKCRAVCIVVLGLCRVSCVVSCRVVSRCVVLL